MKFKELMKRLDESGIGPEAEVISVHIEPPVPSAPFAAPPAAPGTKPTENLTIVVRA